jgi:hypothetical protein
MKRRKIKVPAPPPERDASRVIERPDGFYWQSFEDNREFGPFPTSLEALQHMQLQSESELEPGESLEEAEDEVGISGWVDPDTGELAEEGVPRLEDH